jgi:hypothetical protein
MNIKCDLAEYLVRIDSNYLNEKGDLLVKLKKALYGCVQSSKLWYLTLKKVFEEDGFTCSTNDPCVFVKRVGDVLVIVSVYVDDIILQSDHEEAINEVINLLKVKFHEIKVNRGKKHQYLGMLFDFIWRRMVCLELQLPLLTQTSSLSMMQSWCLMKRVKRRCVLWFINSSMCALGWSLRLSLQ